MKPAFEHDRIELYLGDCLRVLPQLKPGSIDALITDPPYSSGGQYKGDRSAATGQKYTDQKYSGSELEDFSGDNRDQRSFLTWCNLWLDMARDSLAPGGIVALFSDWRQLPTMTDALQVAGYVWRGIVPWAKPTARPQMGRFTAQCEYLIWAVTAHSQPIEASHHFPGSTRQQRHATGSTRRRSRWR